MVDLVLNISDSKTGKTYKKEISGPESDFFLNRKIGDDVKGDSIGLKGYELSITGASDKGGFPLRKDVAPGIRKKPLLVKGIGAKIKGKGLKQRKTIRGNIINEDVKQINLKIKNFGLKKIDELFGESKEESEKPSEKTEKKEVKEKNKDGKEEEPEEKK